MPTATLLLREPAITSLTSIVEKSQRCEPPYRGDYEIRLNSSHLEFVLLSKVASDEGFESDDAGSIVSSDDNFNVKNQETDSAHGSASSDSDAENAPESEPESRSRINESYFLVDCVCYSDIKFPNILVFVIKGDVFVFRFGSLDGLKTFYTSFSTFKAIATQRVLHKSVGSKTFNLLHRTDRNGVTHIEIKKEAGENRLSLPREPSSIISLNTPEINTVFYTRRPKASMSDEINQQEVRANKVEVPRKIPYKSASIENILDTLTRSSCKVITRTQNHLINKVWNSAEDLLDDDAAAPTRPERRKRVKQRAPPPPDVFRGQYVRVSVDPKPKETTSLFQSFAQKVLPLPVRDFTLSHKPPPKDLLTFQQYKFVEPKRLVDVVQNRLNSSENSSWTNSVPRFLKKHRSQSETRNFTPMAYRYIDTTSNYHKQDANVSNRLFGLTSKLKEFGSVNGTTIKKKYANWQSSDVRRNSLGDIGYQISGGGGGSLKSVIKKDENKRRSNEKKVTFSAYTTVQVV